MQISVENISSLGRRVNVIIPVQQVQQKYNQEKTKIAKSARVDGYRKGHLPLEKAEELFHDKIHENTIHFLLNNALKKTLEQENLTPAGQPTLESIKEEKDQPMEFVFSFDIFPTISLCDFSQLEIESLTCEFTEADLDKTLDRIREQFKNWEEVQREAKMGDQVTFDFEGTLDGVPFQGGSAKNFKLILGSKQFINGFEDALVGLKAGDKRDINLNFPENYHQKDLAGKAVVFSVEIHQVSEGTLPEVNDEFIKMMGVADGNLDAFKQKVKDHVEQQLEQYLKKRLKDEVFSKLLSSHEFELPESLIQQEIAQIHDERHKGEHDHNHSEAEKADWRELACKRIKSFLLFSEIVKSYHLQPDRLKVQKIIEQNAFVYDDPKEFVSWVYSDKKFMMQYENLALEEEIVELVTSKAKIKTKQISYEETQNA